jgi:cytosine/adenosine deaminase-related metal-dependent hydrolase
VTLFRGTVVDTPEDPFAGGRLRVDHDAGLLVHEGTVVARGGYDEVRATAPDDEVVDLRDGLVLPGFVDTHVHFPQVRAVGGLGMPLLEWLERCALPEEERLGDVTYARQVAREFVDGLVEAGTTTAMVFGAHFAPAVDALFAEAQQAGLRITSGLVVSDRLLPASLWTTPARAHEEGLALARRWHGVGRTRYAVTPRFALSCTDDLLASCASLHADVAGSWATTHLNENLLEIAGVGRLFDDGSYVDSYDRHGLVSARSVLAHNVHPTDGELDVLAARGAAVAHCPTSNSALGSGHFPSRGTCVTASGWPWAPTSAPDRASACSRRGSTRTTSSSCWASRACASRRPTCSTSRRPPGRPPSGWATRSATSASASASTPRGCGPGPARSWTSRCATRATPRTPSPRRSRSGLRPTCGRGSTARRSTGRRRRRCRGAGGDADHRWGYRPGVTPTVLGIVLAGGEGKRLMPLTADRAKPPSPSGACTAWSTSCCRTWSTAATASSSC